MTEPIHVLGWGPVEQIQLSSWPVKGPPQCPSLAGELHIWHSHRAESARRIPYFLPYLSLWERQKAMSFAYGHERDDFILGRGVLRKLLAHYLGVHPKEVDLRRNRFGKPEVVGAPYEVKFNLAQSGDEQVYVFTLEREVGIDIEYIDPQVDFWALAEQNFSAGEYRQLFELPERRRIFAFYRAWTQKEAYMKALGRGYEFSSKDCEVLLDPHREPRLLHSQDSEEFEFLQLNIAAGYSCSVAHQGRRPQVRLYAVA